MWGLFTSRSKPKKTFLNIAIIGDSDVGKTCFVRRVVEGRNNPDYEFEDNHITTRGSHELYRKNFVNRGETFTVNIFDTAGNTNDHSKNRDVYVSCADAVIVMFDVNSPETRQNVSSWVANLKKLHGETTCPPIVVVGNKVDEIDSKSRRKNLYRVASLNYPDVEIATMSVKANRFYNKDDKEDPNNLEGLIQMLIAKAGW